MHACTSGENNDRQVTIVVCYNVYGNKQWCESFDELIGVYLSMCGVTCRENEPLVYVYSKTAWLVAYLVDCLVGWLAERLAGLPVSRFVIVVDGLCNTLRRVGLRFESISGLYIFPRFLYLNFIFKILSKLLS